MTTAGNHTAAAYFNYQWRFELEFAPHRLYAVASESIIRNVLVRVDPAQLDRALQRWNDAHGVDDEVLAIDGKTLCNTIHEDQDGPCQTHILSAVGHRSQTTHTQKK